MYIAVLLSQSNVSLTGLDKHRVLKLKVEYTELNKCGTES
jgi:hypothetical protein